MRNALQAGRESAMLSRSLVQLREDGPVRLDLEAAIRALCDLGFGNLATRVPEF